MLKTRRAKIGKNLGEIQALSAFAPGICAKLRGATGEGNR